MDGAYQFLRVSNIPEEVSEDTLPPRTHRISSEVSGIIHLYLSSYILILTKHLVSIYQQIRQPFPKITKYCYFNFLGISIII